MAQTRNPKGAQRKLIQDRLRDGYDTLFSGKEEPPTDLSIRQADELRARVAELEAKLEQQSGVVEKKSPSTAAVTDSQSRYTSAALPPQQEDVISVWRERLVNFILRVGVVIGFIGWFVYLFIDIPKQNWSDLTVITIVLAVLTAITFLKVPYVVRSYGLVALVFSLYLNALTQSGVRGDANVFLLTAVILALMLLGLRPGVVVMGIAILAMMGAGWVVTNHQFTLRDLFDQLNPSTWIAHGVATDMMAAILATGIIMLQREFSSAQKRERTAMDEVYRERGHLAMRVEERTHDLQLASEVGRTITEKVANLHEMLTTAAEMIRTRFGLYYTQVYLMDPSRKSLTLRAGTGNVGQELLKRGHHLPISSGSMNGRAAVERKVVIVEDTTTSPTFLPNPLLPNTRSEMAIPLIAGGQVIGVLDMQSETPGALNQWNLPALEALAGQLAIAIQNATLFTEAEQARFEVEVQVHRLTKQGWQDFLDAIERGQKIGFSFDQTSIIPLEADAISLATIEETFSTPITVTGTKIGAIELAHEPDRTWTANETELIQLTANQLGQHVENLRLLAQAEKYRAEAEDAVRRLTREGWDTYLQAHSEETVGYAYDLNEVHPLNKSGKGHPSETTRPLAVQDEIVGELSINMSGGFQPGANELLSAVASQLSAHIENLRLSTSNMTLLKATEERAQREQALRQITTAVRSSTDPTAIMRIAVRELGSILGRKTVIRMATTDQAETAANNGNVSDLPVDSSPSSAVGGKKWKKRKS